MIYIVTLEFTNEKIEFYHLQHYQKPNFQE